MTTLREAVALFLEAKRLQQQNNTQKETKKMDEKQYMGEIKRTMNYEIDLDQRLSMLALGLAGEVGEIVDHIKKAVYHGHEIDHVELGKEFGDVMWYLYNLMDDLGVDPDIVRFLNVEKLRRRYPEGFSEEASQNREE
ncbi:nucleoside triphosphate pyrophosphohydrolase family protein [Bacillus paralicheniformis]|uniref:nucleoside triphosphate pyrophosphohydrolase family protein n=1 Tax=Bacillus paralicheniformis TaxID=1648923 RepID=UPI0021BD0E6A|nr:nucleoside triphosphate pyrophosphohydrolase family protein [Bacillus paralicheniformis]